MRRIEKGKAPECLSAFRRTHPSGRYPDLSERERQAIREACTQEQFHLCAYCCQAISGENDDTMNEHVEAQRLAPGRTLDFGNLVASCKTLRQCDAAHASQALPLTPLMPECETELRFRFSGRVEGLTDRARESISVLNLGDSEEHNKALIEKRKQFVDALIWRHYGSPQDLQVEEDQALIQMLIDDLSQPKNGRLEAFSPVLVSILREFVAKAAA